MSQAPETQDEGHRISKLLSVDQATDQFVNQYMSNIHTVMDVECDRSIRLIPLPPSDMEYNGRSILKSFKINAQNDAKFILMQFDINRNIKSIFNPRPKPATYVGHLYTKSKQIFLHFLEFLIYFWLYPCTKRCIIDCFILLTEKLKNYH